ncbi:S1/P1 nuclease [Pedobacter sp.]|jgi:hypothetical protein|uniref:S1/P1 nuclease n=1 Tax=Pedobacter sp. TaxID=1411316 RepID=UPI002C57D349|nr:S1/P1 nuclease [Pedobacter sp.]HWW43055.1 S1/P1 nuclease [Pedobacter sp.]
MKKRILIYLLFPLGILIGSWGAIGHQTVARVAENHLTPEAKLAVKDLLGNETLPGISSWADQVRSEPAYKATGPYHFVNLPSGLPYKAFEDQVKSLKKDNLYSALLQYEKALSDPNNSKDKRIEALKFVVHLVGDAHQPMHVSRAEDKGGNTIQVQFDGKGTNLHSLWDSRMIDRLRLSSVELAEKCNQASPAQIKQWQATAPVQWLYESYQLSNRLYAEVEKGNKLSDDYYTRHLPEIQSRIEMAGVRLAGVLNQIFKNYKPSAERPQENLNAETRQNTNPIVIKNTAEVVNYLGKYVTVTDVVYDFKVISNNLTLLNLGGKYPNQILTIAIKGPSDTKDWKGKKISVSGIPKLFKGKPEIETHQAGSISFQASK